MPPITPHRWRRAWWQAILASALLAPLLVLYVAAVTLGQRFADPVRLPDRPVAIVFGAGVWEGGRPSPMLADRLDAAVALYAHGRVDRLLMTGDGSSPQRDEVAVMRRYAVEQGVPSDAIVVDPAGYSTYDSCARARAVFDVDHAIVVTQSFHLPRAVYTCRALGIDALGLGTPDWGVYGDELMARYTLRESLATLNALWEVHVTRPQPVVTGPSEARLE